jgi:GGDEF domain-containing protein
MSESAKTTTCILFDVCGMQAFNEEHGWECGDKLLDGITTLLENRFPAPCDVTRLLGDEFLIVTKDSNAELQDKLARTALDEIQKRFSANITFCIGRGILVSEARRSATIALFERRARC